MESSPHRPRLQPSPSSFSSLPEDIVLCILARISTSYYPKLSLVSKSFHSLILSKDLEKARYSLRTRKACVYVCLQLCNSCDEYLWFSLWIKPDDHQTLPHPCDRRRFTLWVKSDDHKKLTYCRTKDKSTGNLLVPVPSSYSPRLPRCCEMVGSELYEIGGRKVFSSKVWVYDNRINKWCKAPRMMVARKNALTCPSDGKLYVFGGCEASESTYWAEVFDPKTQTWKPLPDPGIELRNSLIKNAEVKPGKVYLRTNEKNFVYLTKENRWGVVVEENLGNCSCEIENILYSYANEKCWWYDTKSEERGFVRGLTKLNRKFRRAHQVEMGSYGGKLVMFWVGPAAYSLYQTSELWCAVILLKERHHGEVWGQIEWVDFVLRVPCSHTIMRCVESAQ